MARGKKPDPSRKKNCAPHSNYFKCDNGKKLGAYIAGEMYGCETHRTFATQPCVASITDDALPCVMCQGGLIPEWRGYVPLWDCDWTLHHALINKDYCETVDCIPHRAKVSVSRAKNPISPLVIRDEPMLTRELPNRAPWSLKVNMLAVCLTLWKNPDLVRWFEINRPDELKIETEVVAPVVAPAPVAKQSKPAAVVKPYQGATSPADTPDTIAATGARIMNRLKERAAKNGKHD